ncbi:MAG: hypothetical protein HY848_07450 [Betaproteobacteria bacterium]|nr:hypothetical protein [Betaproteobacteria bacterium]
MSSKTEKPANTVSGKTEKPTNLRADVMPKDGYVLSVDGKLKTRYETSEDAMTAAVKLKQSYPVIQVTVFDAAARSHSPVLVPEQ